MTKFVVLIVKPSKNTQTQRCNNIKNVHKFQQKKIDIWRRYKNLNTSNASIDTLVRSSINPQQVPQILFFIWFIGSEKIGLKKEDALRRDKWSYGVRAIAEGMG